MMWSQAVKKNTSINALAVVVFCVLQVNAVDCSTFSAFVCWPKRGILAEANYFRSFANSNLLHLMKSKRNLYRKSKADVTKPDIKLDEFFIGKYGVEWKILNVKEKFNWRHRDMQSPPLRTSRFELSGMKGFQLKYWPHGNSCSKIGYCALHLFQPEHWQNVDAEIYLFVGKFERGPFKFRSQEYFQAAHSLCKSQDLDLSKDELVVGVKFA
ncbi:hypothetical protein IE077_001476 [Cardiosporidium cionae]|uniref:Uncharacterized protein n=1 Tax=Cardiosporidium cionae TaxID=476202 RepID=A0ABQ7JGA0_9APIC|nr:hypothetical protein IE077_001476 [Cardiosporidium cionae]|eukprot:KAF8823001.1 hypothetical protein IE077_001476 [Cardiosporidium cionae]